MHITVRYSESYYFRHTHPVQVRISPEATAPTFLLLFSRECQPRTPSGLEIQEERVSSDCQSSPTPTCPSLAGVCVFPSRAMAVKEFGKRTATESEGRVGSPIRTLPALPKQWVCHPSKKITSRSIAPFPSCFCSARRWRACEFENKRQGNKSQEERQGDKFDRSVRTLTASSSESRAIKIETERGDSGSSSKTS